MGIPRSRKKRLSVAPVLSTGIGGTPGHMSALICSTGSRIVAVSGEGGLGVGWGTVRPPGLLPQ